MKKIFTRQLFSVFVTIFLFSGVLPQISYAQEKQDTAPPKQQLDPGDLSPGWWKDLTSKEKNLQKTIDEIIKKVEPYTETLSEENKVKAKSFVKDIKLNLQSYLKIIEQPLQEKPPTPPIAKSYTIDQLIELNNTYVREAIELAGRKDERSDLQQVIENLGDRMDLVRQNYLSAEERSEAKILFGLETISLHPAIDVAELKLKLINRSIENKTKTLEFLSEEIEKAKDRLVSDRTELSKFARQLDPKMRVWEDEKRERQKIETALAKKYSDEPTEEAKVRNQFLNLQQIVADLKEIEAHNRFIRAEIIYSISKILNEPKEVDLESLTMALKDWSSQLSTFKPMISEWKAQTERVVDRSAQLLSLNKTKPSLKTDREREILEKSVELGQQNFLSIQGLNKEIEESVFLHSVAEKKLTNLQGEGVRWARIVTDFLYDVIINAKQEMGTTLFYFGSHPVTAGGILQFALIMMITWWASKFLTATLTSFAKTRKGVRKAVIYRIRTLFRYLILLIGLLAALSSIGLDFSNLAIIAGALGIGIGFGLQNIFNDFISGLIILFQSYLKVGDFVELDTELRGEIREINVRSTVITTNDGVDVLVPNSAIVSSKIINWTLRDPYRRMHIPFGVAYGSDIDEVARVVIEAAKKVPSTLEKIGVPEPEIFMTNFGNSALEFELVVWVNEKWTRRHRKTTSLYLWAIEKALKKHGITVPFPQRDLHIKTVLDKNQLSNALGIKPGDRVKPQEDK